ncbi:MAG: threonine ammonia-lyase [Methanomicrobiaceae archaeon]|uniref:threonine ammonia-lyase n=1 Tax=hydrocarbon metagenome TaxID=938273 RepID=A0A0W8FHN9_9ZZZZ|nr:threonine ammonia-lyase [Methanomicrobiaceae archaeon]MDD5418285.1 threonine ammonia-lyase [Methanomicrobiaceae archaeon]
MITPDDLRRAAALLQGRIIRTPLVYSPGISRMAGAHVYLKLENLQKTGAFKVRGATYKILSNAGRVGPGGVVAASAGNHAQGVALAAREAGIPATIVMPERVSLAKQAATREYGAEIVLSGENLSESLEAAVRLAESRGAAFVHPFDDPEIILGQATIGQEILEDLPETDLVIVPVGGGGLIAGIASAVRVLRPQTRVVGVQAAACPSAALSCREGRRIPVDPERTIADGIAVSEVGGITFPIMRDLVEEIVLVDEDQIIEAMVLLLERKKVLAEGAGAAPLAALLGGSIAVPEGGNVVLVVSGGNIDPLVLDRVLRQGFLWNGRIMRFSVCLEDEPGSLVGLLALITRLRANVLDIHHARHERGMPITASRVDVELETRGHEHIAEITAALTAAGYQVQVRQ